MTITYITSKESVAFMNNGEVYLINADSNSYFAQIREALERGLDLAPLEHLFDIPSFIKHQTAEQFVFENGTYYYEGEEIPSSIGTLLYNLLQANLPYQPLIKFWHKLKQHPNHEIQGALASVVADRSVSLTWEGDIVLYRRSSWNRNAMQGVNDPLAVLQHRSLDWSGDFAPGKTVTSTREPLLAGSFDWISRACPDQGAMFDIVVNPVHVVQCAIVGNLFAQSNVQVSEFTYLSRLEEITQPNDRVCFVQTRTNSIGEVMLVREPYSDQALRAYLSSVLTGSNSQIERSQPIQVTNSGC